MSAAPAMDPLSIPLPGRHVVEASAGTGKTFTIATLHLRFVVEAGVPIGRVLVATFTDAATAELKDRLRRNLARAKRLADAALAGEPVEPADAADGFARGVLVNAGAIGPGADPARAAVAARRLERALSAFDAAPVFTLHGFCQRLLADLALETGSRFEEELLTDDAPLLDAAVAGFAASAFGAEGAALADAAPERDGQWASLRLAARLAVGHPNAAVEPGVASFEAAEARLHALTEPVRQAWGAGGEAIRAELHRLAPGLHGAWTKKLEQNLGDLAAAIDAADWAAIPEAMCWSKVRGKGDNPKPEPAFFEALEVLREAACSALASPDTAVLTAAASAARTRVADAKRLGGVLTFDDLLHRVDAALADPATGPGLVAEARRRYPVAMIDEVQDTDPVQHRILERLFGDAIGEARTAAGTPRSFLSIGDPKQSIYRFRGADVGGFVASRGLTPEANRHGLRENFRSDAPLVAAVQAVFAAAGDKPFGPTGIGLAPVAAAAGRRTTLTPALDVAWVPVGGPAEGQRPEKFPAKDLASRAVVRALVADLTGVLAGGAKIGSDEEGGGRPIAAADLAVLCETNRQLDAVADALAAAGVPTVRPSGASVFASPEAPALVDLAAAWLEPAAKHRLRRAMLGPVLGHRPEDLADDASLSGAAALAAECGRRWRRSGFAAAVDHAMGEAGTVTRLAAQPRGERSITNLGHLTELLQGLAREHGLGPEPLLARLRAAIARPEGPDGAVAGSAELRLESDAAAVTLLTVHRSKGLEFPIVFLPFLWDGGERRAKVPTLARRDAAGAALEPAVIDAGSERLKERQGVEKTEEALEKRRLLYVALTRARHQTRVLFAATKQTAEAALGALMLEATVAAPPADAAAWRPTLDAWATRIHEFAAADAGPAHAPFVAVRDAAAGGAAKGPPAVPTGPPPTLTIRALSRTPPEALRSASFTSISAGGHGAAAGPEVRDLDAGAGVPGVEDEPEAAPGPLDGMPGGTGVGSLVHAVLEDAIAEPALRDRPAAAAFCRRRVAARAATLALPPEWVDPLGDALADTLAAPIPLLGGDGLLATDPALRAIELPFVLRVRGDAAAGQVADALAGSDHAATRATAERLRAGGGGRLGGFFSRASWTWPSGTGCRRGGMWWTTRATGWRPIRKPRWRTRWSARCTCCRATSTSPRCTACCRPASPATTPRGTSAAWRTCSSAGSPAGAQEGPASTRTRPSRG